jgi:hypothetical protein
MQDRFAIPGAPNIDLNHPVAALDRSGNGSRAVLGASAVHDAPSMSDQVNAGSNTLAGCGSRRRDQ